MKLSFSTVGCPDWLLNECLAAANDFGYDGLEIRGLGVDLFLPKAPCFGPRRLKTSLREIADSRLEIPCIASDNSCLLSSDNPDVVDNVKAYIDLAALIGAKNIRLLADEWGPPTEGLDKELVYERIMAVLPYAAEKQVTLLVETNGVYADTKVLRALIERVGSPFLQVLWDINHPFTYFGESAQETFDNIGRYVRHVHMKDSVMEDGRISYKMLGHGDLPITEILSLLNGSGFDGHYSLEWMKRWVKDLEEPGVVFLHYARKIKRMAEQA